MPRSFCVENCSNHEKSLPNLNFYISSFDKQQCWRWLQAIGQAQQHVTFMHSSLVDQLHTRKCIFAVLCQNTIKHESNIHQNVFIKYSPKCI